MAVPFGLLSWAETRLTSSVTGLMIATVPIVSAVVAAQPRPRRPSQRQAIRRAGRRPGRSGTSGRASTSGSVTPGRCSRCSSWLPATRWGRSSSPQTRGGARHRRVMAAAASLTALAYLPWLVFAKPQGPVSATAWWSVVALGVVCSALAFVVLFALVDEVGPTG